MTEKSQAAGDRVPGPSEQIRTGNKVMQSEAWYTAQLPHCKSIHSGLEHTADTISAGQANSAHGIGTSWLTPESPPIAEPVPILLQKPSDPGSTGTYNHIVWHGSHSILLPSIVADTPEVADGQEYQTITGTLRSTWVQMRTTKTSRCRNSASVGMAGEASSGFNRN